MPPRSRAVEREVKLGAHPTFVLPDLTATGAPAPDALPEVVLTATYWDTADLRLARAGASLRHRGASDRSEQGWTVKLPKPADGTALHRLEVGFAGKDGQPPAEAAALVAGFARREPLAPVAKLVTRRRRTVVRDADGTPALEVADDEVSVMDGRRLAARFRELEVEVLPGAHAGADLLDDVVGRLQAAGAGAADPTSKVVRALGPRALAGPDVQPVTPRPGGPAGEVVHAAIAAGTLRLLAHDPGVRLGEDDEDVHQARVATRRLRSDLATFRNLLQAEWVEVVRDELAWVAGELGAVRDADVLLERLSAQAAQLAEPDASNAVRLLSRLAQQRQEAKRQVQVALGSPRYLDLLEVLVSASRLPPLTEDAARPAAKVVPSRVAKAWAHLEEAVAEADREHGDDEHLHEIRKKAKRCRYAAEAAVPTCGKPAAKLARAVADLQGVLGELQDGVVAEGWLRGQLAALDGPTAPTQAFTAGVLVGVQRAAMAEARAGWRAAWEAASSRKLRSWLA